MKILNRTKKTQKMVASLYILGPSIFYHSIFYTESLYTFITIIGLMAIYKKILIEKMKISKIPLKNLLGICLLFSSAGFVRSVGFFNAAYICYPLLLEIADELSQKKWKKINSKILKIFFVSIIFLLPNLIIQFISFSNYCKGIFSEKKFQPNFCEEKFPNYYSYIQKEYWNVFFLSWFKRGFYEDIWVVYFSFPIWCTFLYQFIKNNDDFFGIAFANIPKFLRQNFDKKFDGRFFGENRLIFHFPDFVILAIFGFFSFFFANVCSIDRFLSTIPYYYILLAKMFILLRKNQFTYFLSLFFLLGRYLIHIGFFSQCWIPL